MINNLPTTSVTRGLVGEWLLDGNANDTSGNGNNGTATNVTYVKTSKGYQSQAGSFNGSSSYAEISSTTLSTLINGRTGFSINLIIKLNSLTNGQMLIDGRDTDYSGFYIEIINSGQISVRRSDGVVNDYLCVTQTLSTGVWYNIGITYDGTNGKIYVDGSEKTGLTSTKTLNSGTVTSIGRRRASSDRLGYLNGTIQSIRIYNTVLTQDEIQTLYLEGQRKLGPSNIANYPQLMEGLVGYWDMRGTAHNLVDGVLATTTASLSTDRFGNGSSSYLLSGGTDKISTGLSQNIGTNDFTIFCWYKTSSLAGNPNIFSTNNASNYVGVQLVSNVLYFEIWTSNITYTNPAIYDGNWHFIEATRNGSNMTLYFDGVQVSSGTVNQSGGNGQLVFGGRGFDTASGLTGNIGDCGIMMKGISADEASLLYKLTSQEYIYPCKTYDLPNLREGLVLDLNAEGKDLSGNGNNAVLYNSPTIYRKGKIKGLVLDGSNKYMDFPSIDIQSSTTFTFNTFINKNSNSDYQSTFRFEKKVIIQQDTSANGYIYYFSVLKSDNSAYQNIQYLIPVIGKDYMLTLTYNNGVIKAYVDGVNVGTLTGQTTYTGAKGIQYFGRETAGYYFNGKTSKNRIRNRALSDKEIQQLYYSQKSNFIL